MLLKNKLYSRAVFAKSILENAIHSPSTTESAKEKISIVFGDTEFNWDGTAVRDMPKEDDGMLHVPVFSFY